MSVQTALDNIWLRPAARWGHTEYSLEYHRQYLVERAGLPFHGPDFFARAWDTFDLDFLFMTNGELIDWTSAGRTTDMGHASYAADGFIFEPCNDLGWTADNFGQSHCLVGSFVDCRDLTLGNWGKVLADINRAFACLDRCRGAIIAMGTIFRPISPRICWTSISCTCCRALRKDSRRLAAVRRCKSVSTDYTDEHR